MLYCNSRTKRKAQERVAGMGKLLTPTRRKIITVYAWVLSVGLLYYGWIRLTGKALPCFYRAATGLLCPGCGATRMFTAMLRLEFAEAFRCNPAVFCCFWLWNGIALLCASEKWEAVRRPAFLYTALGATVTALVAFGLLRNVW